MINTTKPTRPADPALAVADVMLARHRAEVELVAAAAGSPRQSLALLSDLGVTDDDVANLDTLAVWLALRNAAATPGPVDAGRVVVAARSLLRSVDAWDDDETRSFVTGGLRWGPGGLVRLLTAVPFAADTVRLAVARLADADRRQRAALAPDVATPNREVAA